MVGWPFRMSGSGREALPDVREWSVGPPGCLRVVWRPTWMSNNFREALPEVREALPEVRQALPEVREALPDVR